MRSRARAAVIDEWALVRTGVELALEAAEVDVVFDEASAGDVIGRLRARPVDLVVVGAHADGPMATTISRLKALAESPLVIGLVERAGREELAAMAGAGADGLLLRSVGPDDLTDATRRVLAGERVLAPALVPSLVGVVSAPEQVSAALLTPKELAVLGALADGRSNREIADSLYMSPATVKSHLERIYDKLEVGDRRAAVARALSLGLLRPRGA